ncbi:MAG: LysM peptidoglycan-binding domain-containing protein [Calditrichia bacterium]|nr:LysM peptidoglycan-binding domain-containing protein [Calditrichia bacterium]
MKQIVKIAGCMLMLVSLSACNVWIFKKSPKTAPAAELQQISAYLNAAESNSISEDAMLTDGNYLKALEKADSLSTLYPEDSLLTALYFRVNDSYDSYLHRMVVLDADTLTEEEMMIDIERLFAVSDSAGFAVDSLEQLRIPLILNKKIENAIKYFSETRRGRKTFEGWLRRAGKYEKLVKGILRETGAPEELFYLAMIESGLRPQARSYARAVGMWQFISATGRYYGLTQSWWYDDRQDVIKASRAAGQHLLDLYERFGDWYIGIAGYNFSPGKIEKRIKTYNVSEFWDLPKLPKQTRNYVPTYLAAVTIASNLEKYNFADIIPDNPIEFDTVTIKQSIDLNIIAEAVGSTYNEIRDLNPAILRWCTPPDVDEWLLYLPSGTRDTFLSKYDNLPKSQKMDWVQHRIRSGETLSTIARRYGVSITEVKHFNKLSGNLIRAGRTLMIPIPAGKNSPKAVASNTPKSTARKSTAPRSTSASLNSSAKVVADVPGHYKQVYTIRSGDNLWEVAKKFGVSVNELREWNGLNYSRIIRPGQKLNIWLPNQSGSTNDALASANLPVPGAATVTETSGDNKNTYIVRSGDTLWDIARAHNVSINDLKRWNAKRNNKIKPGEELVLYAD